jgi:hypothetical protein
MAEAVQRARAVHGTNYKHRCKARHSRPSWESHHLLLQPPPAQLSLPYFHTCYKRQGGPLRTAWVCSIQAAVDTLVGLAQPAADAAHLQQLHVGGAAHEVQQAIYLFLGGILGHRGTINVRQHLPAQVGGCCIWCAHLLRNTAPVQRVVSGRQGGCSQVAGPVHLLVGLDHLIVADHLIVQLDYLLQGLEAPVVQQDASQHVPGA